ncbi:Phosphoserine phosphatase [Fusarium oxysporum f. sp. albedinis]|nr:Phosphoserine phosphatase [Fusarium oxysporum f. sp. albedinis]
MEPITRSRGRVRVKALPASQARRFFPNQLEAYKGKILRPDGQHLGLCWGVEPPFSHYCFRSLAYSAWYDREGGLYSSLAAVSDIGAVRVAGLKSVVLPRTYGPAAFSV